METPVQKAWRDDPQMATRIMKEIFPSQPDYDLVLTQLSESIYQAKSVAPKAWAVTLFTNGFRLNVGNVEVLTAFRDDVRLLVHGAVQSVDQELLDSIEASPYNVPGENHIFRGSIEQFRRYRDVLLPAHHDFIVAAGTTKTGRPVAGTPHRASHSSGLADLAESVALLRSGGRSSMNGSRNVVFSPGQIYRRRELHDKFGGQRQGGISTPAKASFIFLITGDSGKQHGYMDEWTEDGFFLYIGEGQHGDMRFVGGNQAIRDHLKNGKALQVFEQDKKDKRFLRYLGEMEYTQHSYREAPDTDGKQRKAIVFHLRPVGTLSPDSAVVTAALAGEGPVSSRGGGGGFGSVETNRRVETAAIEFVKRRYEQDGWTVRSVEAAKVGYDLNCDKGNEQAHVEVKGTQGDDVCFIITAAEVRNAMIDRRHLTCIVTAALAATSKMFTLTRDDFEKKIQLDPIAYRAQMLPK